MFAVEKLVKESGKRVTVKVRLLPSGLEDSIALYERLVDAGASLLTVHGRTRHQKGQLTGVPDWDAIAAVVKAVGDRIPVVANGGISNMDDVRRCLEVTKARGVMSSEGVLEVSKSAVMRKELGEQLHTKLKLNSVTVPGALQRDQRREHGGEEDGAQPAELSEGVPGP